MARFIDDHRDVYGVEPTCRVILIAASTYYAFKARGADPSVRATRAKRDAELRTEIQRVWDEKPQVYGAEKVSRKLNRQGIAVARCTVELLMREVGLEGTGRGRRFRTTVPPDAAERPLDLVKRNLTAAQPNQLWVSAFTYVGTVRGFVPRRIRGGRVQHPHRGLETVELAQERPRARCAAARRSGSRRTPPLMA